MIKERFDLDAVLRAGRKGQFNVIVGNETIAGRGGNWFTRQFGAGYPDFDRVVASFEKRL